MKPKSTTRRFLCLLFVLGLACGRPTVMAQDSLTNGLVGYWSFDEQAGQLLLDRSGNGNHGTLYNYPTDDSQWVPGQVAGALRFGGPVSQNHVLVPDYPKPTSQLTIALWVWADSRPAWASFVKNWGHNADHACQFHFGLNVDEQDMSNYITQAGGGTVMAREDTPFPLNSWQQVAFICDGARMILYRNGVEVGSATYDGTIQQAPLISSLAIGCKTDDSGLVPDNWNPGFWDGKMDELGLWHRALSPGEVAALYVAGMNGQPLTVGDAFNQPPFILYQLSNQEVMTGTTLDLSVRTFGAEPLAYQWQHNDVPLSDGGRIAGATTSRLQISNVQAGDAGAYKVTVSNTYGSTSSVPAFISILFKPPEITEQPADQTVSSGSPVSLSVVVTGSLPMTYQWLRNGHPLGDGNGIAGANTATLTITAVSTADVGVYSVAVDNGLGSVTSLPAALNVIIAPPRITGQPRGQFAAIGSSVSLDVQATGSQPLSFQWQLNGVDIIDGPRVSGSRASALQIMNLSLSDLGSYSVIVSNALGWVPSASVELTTSSAVLSSAVEGNQLMLTWNDSGKGMVLQRTTSLTDPHWQDVPGSEWTNRMIFPAVSAGEFFRLVHGLPGLIAWWPGNGNALDLVGTSHGTLMNGATFAPGIVGQAFSFDGVDDYLQVPFLLGNFTEGTVEFWFNLASWDHTPASAGVFLWSCLGREMGDGMNVGTYPESAGELMFGIYEGEGGWHWATSGVTPAPNTWYHVAGTWGQQGLRIYVDGQLLGVNQYTGPMPDYVGGNVVGRGYWPYSSIQGKVDELSLYSRALTADEINAIYNAGSAGKVKPR